MKPGEILLGLFRHGPAENRDATRFPEDDLRPLTPKGRRRVQACAKGMAAAGFIPERILFSPTVRTRETTMLLANAFGLPKKALKMEPALHCDSDPRILVRALKGRSSVARTLWVGHEPWLGEAVGHMLGGPPVPVRKCGLALIAPGGRRTKQHALIAFLPPEILAAVQ